MDTIYFSGIVNAETGEQEIRLIHQILDVDAIYFPPVDVQHSDPTLANFYEPILDDDEEDEE